VAEKDRGVKFCTRVRLLSGQCFSHFGGQRSRSPGTKTRLELPSRTVVVGRSVGQSELGAAASRKAVWCDLRLASLLTHLFVCLSVC